jgi:hypothetical protein
MRDDIDTILRSKISYALRQLELPPNGYDRLLETIVKLERPSIQTLCYHRDSFPLRILKLISTISKKWHQTPSKTTCLWGDE